MKGLSDPGYLWSESSDKKSGNVVFLVGSDAGKKDNAVSHNEAVATMMDNKDLLKAIIVRL